LDREVLKLQEQIAALQELSQVTGFGSNVLQQDGMGKGNEHDRPLDKLD
jgi:hypothetical protein